MTNDPVILLKFKIILEINIFIIVLCVSVNSF